MHIAVWHYSIPRCVRSVCVASSRRSTSSPMREKIHIIMNWFYIVEAAYCVNSRSSAFSFLLLIVHSNRRPATNGACVARTKRRMNRLKKFTGNQPLCYCYRPENPLENKPSKRAKRLSTQTLWNEYKFEMENYGFCGSAWFFLFISSRRWW